MNATTDVEPTAVSASYEPSPLAQSDLAEIELNSYREAGGKLGVDWTVLAAADQIESPGGGGDTDQRAEAIGYTLLATGAPDDYDLALEARGGPAFATQVLALAERYRGRSSDQDAPLQAAEAPLGSPADGQLVAVFGQAGASVERGQTIGRVGCSGPCLRPHVHFQILLGSGPDGQAVEPSPYLDLELSPPDAGPALEQSG